MVKTDSKLCSVGDGSTPAISVGKEKKKGKKKKDDDSDDDSDDDDFECPCDSCNDKCPCCVKLTKCGLRFWCS